MDQREAIAYLLIEHIKDGASSKVERCLQSGDSYSWRDILRYEFNTEILLETVLRYDITLPKLMLYEIKSVSAFHYASLLGNRDILVCFLDKDVPVDLALNSGTTALHLASFAGNGEVVQLLVDVYKADLNKQDNYGWSALHYASTQGQAEVVRALLGHDINVNLRDKDGTSAAFRAQVNGHENVVSIICEAGDEDELMNIYERVDFKSSFVANPGAVYAVPNKGKHVAKKGVARSNSEGVGVAGALAEDELKHSATLPAANKAPKQVRLDSIRRVIQSVMTEDEYMRPKGVAEEDDALQSLAGIGRNTLKGVLREELDRFRQQLYPKEDLPAVVPPTKPGGNEYEDLYASISHFGPAPTPPDTPDVSPGMSAQSHSAAGPPLPPRNSPMSTLPWQGQDYALGHMNQVIQLQASESSNAALTESFKEIAPKLGGNWKKLATELPIESNKSQTMDRIKAIEKKYPGDTEKQATAALVEWAINKRKEADVDNLILALRRCKMDNVIEVVERVTQEFTA